MNNQAQPDYIEQNLLGFAPLGQGQFTPQTAIPAGLQQISHPLAATQRLNFGPQHFPTPKMTINLYNFLIVS